MATLADVLAAIEAVAPSAHAYAWDRIGLQIGDRNAPVGRAVVSLDSSLGAVGAAAERGAELVVSHHPVIWEPLKTITTGDRTGRTVQELIRHRIALVAAHTNWDAAHGGINDVLAERVGLQNVRPFGSNNPVRQLKLVVFVPTDNLQELIDALSATGAGVIGAYERCGFFSHGTGTFRAGEGANPAIGEVGRVEEVAETRLEMVVPFERAEAVREALLAHHPYEEPAFDLLNLVEQAGLPIGRIGELPEPRRLRDLVAELDDRLETRSWIWGDPDREIRRVAVVGGAADDEWRAAQRQGADLFLTGEVRQHNALDAGESGLAMAACGHYATEHPGCARLAERLRERLPEIEWILYTPPPGQSGRPIVKV